MISEMAKNDIMRNITKIFSKYEHNTKHEDLKFEHLKNSFIKQLKDTLNHGEDLKKIFSRIAHNAGNVGFMEHTVRHYISRKTADIFFDIREYASDCYRTLCKNKRG